MRFGGSQGGRAGLHWRARSMPRREPEAAGHRRRPHGYRGGREGGPDAGRFARRCSHALPSFGRWGLSALGGWLVSGRAGVLCTPVSCSRSAPGSRRRAMRPGWEPVRGHGRTHAGRDLGEASSAQRDAGHADWLHGHLERKQAWSFGDDGWRSGAGAGETCGKVTVAETDSAAVATRAIRAIDEEIAEVPARAAPRRAGTRRPQPMGRLVAARERLSYGTLVDQRRHGEGEGGGKLVVRGK